MAGKNKRGIAMVKVNAMREFANKIIYCLEAVNEEK